VLTALALVDGPVTHLVPWLWWIRPLFSVVILALIVTLIVVLIRRSMRGPIGPRPVHGGWSAYGPGYGQRSAESTLAERFANGDIDEKEYRARLEVLRANGPVPPAS